MKNLGAFHKITIEIRQGYYYSFKISYNLGKLENDVKSVKRVISNDDIKSKGR